MIKLRSLLKEQQEETVVKQFDFEFESGKSDLSSTSRGELNNIIAEIKNLIDTGQYQESSLTIKINASESKVTNQKPYEEEGSLAKARAKALAELLKTQFPNVEVTPTYQPKAQGPEYDKTADQADDPKYKPYQNVTAKIVINPDIPTVKEYIMDFAIAIPSQAGKAQGAGADLRNSFFKRIGNGEWKSTGNYNNFVSDVRRLSQGQIQGFNPDEISKKTIDNTKKLDILLRQKDINELINNYKPGNTDVDRSIKMHNRRYWLLGIDDIITFLENS
jgi:hypothetical protein